MSIDKANKTKCIRCGKYHRDSTGDIARECAAVQKVFYSGYVYGEGGRTVSHPHITSIEYVSLDEQSRLLVANMDTKESTECR